MMFKKKRCLALGDCRKETLRRTLDVGAELPLK